MSALLQEALESPGPESWLRLLGWFNRPMTTALLYDLARCKEALEAWPWALRVATDELAHQTLYARPPVALELVRVFDAGETNLAGVWQLAAIEHPPALRHLRLRLRAEPPRRAVAALTALLGSPLCADLEVLELGAPELPWEIAACVNSARRAARLKVLRITDARLDDASCGLMLGGYPWTQLRELDLSGNRLGADATSAFARHGQLPALEVLDLSHNLLGDRAAEILANAQPLSTLKHLNIQENPMTEAASDLLFGSWTLGEVGIQHRPSTDGRRVAPEPFGEARSALSQPPSVEAWRALLGALEHARGPVVEEQLIPYCQLRLRDWPEHLRVAPARWTSRVLIEGHDLPALRLCATWAIDSLALGAARQTNMLEALDRYLPEDGALARLELHGLRGAFGLGTFGDREPVTADLFLEGTRLRPREVALCTPWDEPLSGEDLLQIPRAWPAWVHVLDLSGQHICELYDGCRALHMWLRQRIDWVYLTPDTPRLVVKLCDDLGRPPRWALDQAHDIARLAHATLDLTGVVVATAEQEREAGGEYGWGYDDEWE